MQEHDTAARSFARAVTWRVLATLTTVILVFVFTGEIFLAVGIGIVEIIAKMLLFFIHERMWDHVTWGR